MSYVSLHQSRSRDGIILSPDKKKSIEISEFFGTNQIIINFHKLLRIGGAGVASGNFEIDQIEIEWIDNNIVLIKYPKGIEFNSKEDHSGFFGDSVEIRYREIGE